MTVKEFFEVFGDIEVESLCGLYQGYRNKLLEWQFQSFKLDYMVSSYGVMQPKELAFIIEKDNELFRSYRSYDALKRDDEVLSLEIVKVKSFYIDHCINKSESGNTYYYNLSTLKIIVK